MFLLWLHTTNWKEGEKTRKHEVSFKSSITMYRTPFVTPSANIAIRSIWFQPLTYILSMIPLLKVIGVIYILEYTTDWSWKQKCCGLKLKHDHTWKRKGLSTSIPKISSHRYYLNRNHQCDFWHICPVKHESIQQYHNICNPWINSTTQQNKLQSRSIYWYLLQARVRDICITQPWYQLQVSPPLVVTC